jgi:hypothetical protein
MEDEMKVTVIATGFGPEGRTVRPEVVQQVQEPLAPPVPVDSTPEAEPKEEIPFFRKVLAHGHKDDSDGYGPNWSGVDDFDVPTVLRRNMD